MAKTTYTEGYEICNVEGCVVRIDAKGLCGKHYARRKRHGTTGLGIRKIKPIRVEGDVAYVPLSKGLESVIDAADVHLIDNKNWHVRVYTRSMYAIRTPLLAKGKLGIVRMHRVILDAPNGVEVDHVNSDGLDNRRANLRLVTKAQNQHNRRRNAYSDSGFKGVSWHQATGKWQARIQKDGKEKHLGVFDCPKDAQAAYIEASANFHGEFGRTE